MRKPFIAGNWKMYKTPAETKVFFKQLLPLIEKTDIEVGICPPFIDLETAINMAKESSIGIGAQDVYWEKRELLPVR